MTYLDEHFSAMHGAVLEWAAFVGTAMHFIAVETRWIWVRWINHNSSGKYPKLVLGHSHRSILIYPYS